MQNQQVFRRRRRSLPFVESTKTYNIYTQKVSEVETSRRVIKDSFDELISNRSITFDGQDCDIRHKCVQLEIIVSNFRPSRSADVSIDLTVEMDLTEVGK